MVVDGTKLQKRIKCRCNLKKKEVLEDDICPLCAAAQKPTVTWSWAALHHWHLKQCRFKMVELWLLPMPEDPRCTLMLLFSFFAGFAGWFKAQKWGFVQWTASVLVLLARKQLISGSTDSLSQIGVLKTKVVIFFLSNNLLSELCTPHMVRAIY